MSCYLMQRRVLELSDPAFPSPELEAHLDSCPACRAWQERLLRIERNVARLPVPPSTGKERLQRRLEYHFRSAPPAPWRPRWRPAAAVVAAAALLLGVCLWLAQALAPDDVVTAERQADPLLASLLRQNVRLAQAATTRQRLEALADVADDLQRESQLLASAAGAEELAVLARLYEQVVREGVIARATALSLDERRQVLAPVIARLGRTRVEAEQRAAEVPAAAGPLRVIALAARDGDGQLRSLLKEATP